MTSRRQFLRFSVGTLMLIVSVFCVWLGYLVNQANRQQEAVEVIETLNGKLRYDYEYNPASGGFSASPSPVPEWLRELRLEGLMVTLEYVDLHGTVLSEDDLKTLSRHSGFRFLDFYGADLAESALQAISRLSQLEYLNLSGTSVTDTSLSFLKQLDSLKRLRLARTSIGDSTLENVSNLLLLEELFLDETGVTDVGLSHLHKLSNLKELRLSGTNTSDEAVLQLRMKIPDCKILR